ncbi:MAG: hypothetical protein HGB11_02510 [Chlorobiales bacterium]|nr:hypothetical protein [Chlorobiales bacterium]
MATISQKSSAGKLKVSETEQLRAELISKILTNQDALQKALNRDKDNVFLQTLDTEQQQLASFIKGSSVIPDDRLRDFIGIIDDAIISAQREPVVIPEPVQPRQPEPKFAEPKQEVPVEWPTEAPTGKQTIFEEEESGSTDNLLGLDLEQMLGDILTDESSANNFTTDQQDFMRIDGDKIVLSVDEELERGLDEEAKMFEVEKNFRDKQYFKAITVALALNIRFKQGVGRRSDAIVRRQDDIIFQSNYLIAYDYLEKVKQTKGDERIENQLAAIMHLYAALDQQPLAGQDKRRLEMKSVIEKMISRDRAGGQAYIKAGFFKKINVPAPEDKASKSLYWKDKAATEKDAIKKEFYLLMTFASDLTYYPYQIALANFYIEVDRLDEACRYIQIPLPLIKEEGLDFLLKLKQKDSKYADSFIERRFISDVSLLQARLDQPDDKELNEPDPDKQEQMAKIRFRKFIETLGLWQKQLDAMKADVKHKSSSLRIQYTTAFAELVKYSAQVRPNGVLDEFLSKYKATDVRSIQNPNIVSYIDFAFRYSIKPDEKSSTGLAVEGEAEERFENLCKSVVDYFNIEIGIGGKDSRTAVTNVNLDTEHLIKAMQSLGYKFEIAPVLTRV